MKTVRVRLVALDPHWVSEEIPNEFDEKLSFGFGTGPLAGMIADKIRALNLLTFSNGGTWILQVTEVKE